MAGPAEMNMDPTNETTSTSIAPIEPEPVEAEADNYDADADSTYEGEGSLASSTTSIGSSVLKSKEENGRFYHAYKEGKYILPNDEEEKDRLDMQHHLFTLTLGGKQFLAPIPKEKLLHRVLDVGTGTGIWAIEFADEHPESQVLGVDLSPIQPAFVPPNLSFEIDDLEETWTFNYKFDFIYARMLTAAFADWPNFISQCYDNLSPGGYVELIDITFPSLVDDGSWPPNSALKKWGELMLESARNLGRFADSAFLYKQQLQEAGFVDVAEVRFKWPSNRWPKDPHMKELGAWNYWNFSSSLTGITQALFTRGLGWSMQELEVFLIDVRKEMKDTKIHCYYPILVVYGKKPE